MGWATVAYQVSERRACQVFGFARSSIRYRSVRPPQTALRQRLHELADSSVNFVCRPWCRTDDYWDVYWDVTETVKQRFDAEGVSIPFPQRDVHIYQQNAET